MDLGTLGSLTLDWNFFSGLVSVIIINIVLSGDNAVVIAMAVRSLPRAQRMKGIIFGTGAAIVLRVILTIFISSMLQVDYLKIIGGCLLLWIAVKLFTDAAEEDDSVQEAGSMKQAIKIILIADLTMSLDNVLGVGAAAHGDVFLLLFGLGTSIPIIVFTSSLLTVLMDKYPIILYIGAGLLGKVAAEMIATDQVTTRLLNPGEYTILAFELLLAGGVILFGKMRVLFLRKAGNIE